MPAGEIMGWEQRGSGTPRSLDATPTSTEAVRLGGDPLNVLVLGVDKRPDGEEEGGGVRSDTIMLVQLAPDTGRVKLLSVPRDLVVEVAPGEEDRVNAAYASGRVSQAVSAVENYTDVRIDRYAVVDFEGFEDVVDAMGGVRMNVEEGDFPPNTRMKGGIQRLNGHRALLYARYRGTEGGDLDRIERQQKMVAALRSKALRWNSVKKLPAIAEAMGKNVETDMSVGEAVTLGRALIRQGRDARMTAVQLKGTPDTLPGGEQILRPDAAANQAILREFRR
jgi:LCP family protein required for cell wall assembly